MRAVRRQAAVRQTGGVVKTAALVVSLIGSAYLMALGKGSAMPAWLGWFSLVPLFLVIRSWRPVRAMLAGALWGLSLHVLAAVEGEGVAFADVSSLLLLSTVPAVYAYLGAWLTRRIGFDPFALGVAWMGVELAITPVGLGTGLAAATQGEGNFLQSVAGALGYVLVAFLVALASASLVSVLSAVRLSLPQVSCRIASPDGGASVSPQVFFFLSLFAIGASRPRAPPGVPMPT